MDAPSLDKEGSQFAWVGRNRAVIRNNLQSLGTQYDASVRWEGKDGVVVVWRKNRGDAVFVVAELTRAARR
jgi:hypothetical protein